MLLNTLVKIKSKRNKRIGRGLGSGKGKTGGRGTKGQKARGKVPAWMTGGGLPLYKKLPLNRGWGNRKAGLKPIPLGLGILNKLPANSEVSFTTLVSQRIVSLQEAKKRGIKILSKGEIKIPLTFKIPVSKTASEKITKAGGKVV